MGLADGFFHDVFCKVFHSKSPCVHGHGAGKAWHDVGVVGAVHAAAGCA